jgi:hypothetical protein
MAYVEPHRDIPESLRLRLVTPGLDSMPFDHARCATRHGFSTRTHASSTVEVVDDHARHDVKHAPVERTVQKMRVPNPSHHDRRTPQEM